MMKAVSVDQWGKKPDCGQFKREHEERNIEIPMCRLLFQEVKDSQFFQLFHGMWFPVLSFLLVVHSQMSSYFSGSLATEHNLQRDFINTGSSSSINPPVLEALFLLMKPRPHLLSGGQYCMLLGFIGDGRGEGLPRGVWEQRQLR